MKKGILLLAGVSLALAAPVAATGEAGDAAVKAQRGDDFRIGFTLRTRDGEPTAIKRFRFRKLDAVCEGGTTIQVRGKIPYMRVDDRNRFSRTLRRPGKRVKVKGRVSGDLQVVKGTIRARGDFDPTAQNCDSGRVRWRAE